MRDELRESFFSHIKGETAMFSYVSSSSSFTVAIRFICAVHQSRAVLVCRECDDPCVIDGTDVAA